MTKDDRCTLCGLRKNQPGHKVHVEGESGNHTEVCRGIRSGRAFIVSGSNAGDEPVTDTPLEELPPEVLTELHSDLCPEDAE